MTFFKRRSISSTGSYPMGRSGQYAVPTPERENSPAKRSELPGLDLKKWPRLAVTPSMLCSYAYMKGENPDHKNDVLHSALFPGKSRRDHRHRMWLPFYNSESISDDELPRSAEYYWDPVTYVELPLEPGISEQIMLGRRTLSSSPPPESYDEYLLRHPPAKPLGHYTGEEIFANFGYLEVNKTWVDPDSEGQLHNAYVKDGLQAKAMYRTYLEDFEMNPNKESGLPPFRRPQTTSAGIITPDSEDMFYKDFVEYVTDEVDGEGDPRKHRISPTTFARWATGSKLVDRYEDFFVPPTPWEHEPRSTVIEKDIPSRKIKSKVQFDMETGSVMSGIYSVESDPSLLEAPEGVDPIRPPQNFNMMNPQAARDLQRRAYGPAWGDQYQRGINQPSVASNPGRFNSEEGIAMLAEPGKPDTGIREYYGAKNVIKTLQWEAVQGVQQNYDTYMNMEAAGNERSGLQRDIQFLKHRVRKEKNSRNPGPSTPVEEHSDTDHDSIPIDNSPSPTTMRKARTRKEYKRHINEMLQNQAIEVARTVVTQVRLKSELDDILCDIQELTKVKNDLLGTIGVQNIKEIPDLFPTSRIGNRELRMQFNQRFQQRFQQQQQQ